MSGGDFMSIIKVVAFLSAIWFVGRLCKFIKLSPLIGWIAIGIALGPKVVGLIDEHSGLELWKILGTLGVTLMIAESGTHIHFDKIKKVGLSAVNVAITGTFLPLLFGFGLILLLQNGISYKSAFAVGCTMAPTSVGVALKLLTEANQLNSLPGQTIVTAAFLDDVFSIILLVILKSIGHSDTGSGSGSGSTLESVFSVALSFILCFLFLSIGVILAMYLFGNYLPKLLHLIPQYEELKYQPRDEIHLILMILILISYSFIGDYIGSHLLGAFIAGMSFSQVSRSMYVWRRQMKRIALWLVRLFFACSVAFTIPIDQLLNLNAFWKGLILAIISGILGKLLSGFTVLNKSNSNFSRNNKLLIGFAMVGRGEFAYLVAQEAHFLKIIDDNAYAIIVWALLLAVIAAPITFGKALKKTISDKSKTGNNCKIKYFTIQAEGQHHNGIHFEIVDVLHHLKLDILEAKVETDGDVDLSEFIVGIGGDDNNYLDEDKIGEILHDIREAVGDNSAQVQLLPISKKDLLPISSYQHLPTTENGRLNNEITGRSSSQSSDTSLISDNNVITNIEQSQTHTITYSDTDSNDYLLEVKLMCNHQPLIFGKLVEYLENVGVQIVRGHMEDYSNTDSIVIFSKINKKDFCMRTREIKKNLKLLLKQYHVSNEILLKKIRKNIATLPNHLKFSDLLQSSSANNPLLSNNIQNGFEIDIYCKHSPSSNLLSSISEILISLQLDVRTIDVNGVKNDTNSKFVFILYFFVQESSNNNNEDHLDDDEDAVDKRRYVIEQQITEIFTKQNIGGKIKTKAIQMNRNNIDNKENKLTRNNSIYVSNNQATAAAVQIVIDDMDSAAVVEDINNSNGSTTSVITNDIKNMAQITQSTTIITPRKNKSNKLNQQASIKKGKTTFNFIGLVESNSGNTTIIQTASPAKPCIRKKKTYLFSQSPKMHMKLKHDDDDNDDNIIKETNNPDLSDKSKSSSSILNILNEISN